MRVVAIATCFNRRDMTVKAVRSIHEQFRSIDGVDVSFVVVDDNSSDGSSAALRELPSVKVVEGTGDLYWGGGMALASKHIQGADMVLWFNDDVDLYPSAIGDFLEVATSHEGAIVVGSLKDPQSGEITYGGYRVSRRPFRHSWQRLQPDGGVVTADTFNGNIVLFPHDVHAALGGPDPKFTHHYGDFDMGLRARSLGVSIIVAPGPVGETPRNSNQGTFRDNRLPASRRIKALFGPKGFPIMERSTYYRRHAGWTWPAQWLGFYVVWLARIVARR